MIFIMLAISIVLSSIYIVSENFHRPLLAFCLKAFASFSFVLLALSGLYSILTDGVVDSTNALIIGLLFIGGLVAGLLGDLTLALRSLRPQTEDKKIINLGIICFATGHCFFLAALLLQSSVSWLAIVLPIVMTVVMVVMSQKLKYEMGGARYPTFIYSFLIFMMVGQVITNAFNSGFNSYSLILMIGAVLFSISDLILAPIYFSGDKRYLLVALNLIAYYGAQILIAFSIGFI